MSRKAQARARTARDKKAKARADHKWGALSKPTLGTLHFTDYSGEHPHTKRVALQYDSDGDRFVIHCTETLPYPGKWDFARLRTGSRARVQGDAGGYVHLIITGASGGRIFADFDRGTSYTLGDET